MTTNSAALDNLKILADFLRNPPKKVDIPHDGELELNFNMGYFMRLQSRFVPSPELADNPFEGDSDPDPDAPLSLYGGWIDPNEIYDGAVAARIDKAHVDEVNVCGTCCCAVGCGPWAGIPLDGIKDWNEYYAQKFRYIALSLPAVDYQFQWMFDGSWEERDNTMEGAASRIEWFLCLSPDLKTMRAWYELCVPVYRYAYDPPYQPETLWYNLVRPDQLVSNTTLRERNIRLENVPSMLHTASILLRNESPALQASGNHIISFLTEPSHNPELIAPSANPI